MVLFEKVFEDDEGNEAIPSYRCDIQCPPPLWHVEKEEAWLENIIFCSLKVLHAALSYLSKSPSCTV